MEEIWNNVLQGLSVPQEISDRWWQKIIEQYSEEGRVYHNVDKYLRKKTATYETMVKDNITEHSPFVLAMFFQHFEYDVRVYGDSHDKNVQHVKAFFTDAGITHEGLRSTVVGLLGAVCDGGANKEGVDAYFQDLELASLGSSTDEYKQYISDIEREYCNMPNQLYRSLRSKLLQTLLLIPRIYSTNIFHDKFEKQARENIQMEIDEFLT